MERNSLSAVKKLGIVSSKNVGIAPAYDLSMPTTNAYVLENGALAHNCSHSVSYAILAYYEAYIKHHYPLHFWAGKLTSEDNDDKLRAFAAECGVTKQPDLFLSHETDWTIHDGHLLAPLKVVKKVTESAVAELKGHLKDYDFASLPPEERWGSFLAALKKAKAQKIKVPAPALMQMLYLGSLNRGLSIAPTVEALPIYAADLLKAIGSKTKPPEVKTKLERYEWAAQNCPVMVFPYVRIFERRLRTLFDLQTSIAPCLLQGGDYRVYPSLSDVFEDDMYISEMMDRMGSTKAMIVGKVLTSQTRQTKNGKEFMIVSFNTGSETASVKVWSAKGGDKISNRDKALYTPGAYLAVVVTPSVYNGFRDGSAQKAFDLVNLNTI